MAVYRFVEDTSGGVTLMNLVWMMVFFAIGGLAVDGANAFRMRAMMQATADAAALAAAADLPDEDAARATALEYVEMNMPSAAFGEMARSADLVFGTWDESTDRIIDSAQVNAIEVALLRGEARDNALPTFLTRIIGHDSWSIRTNAIALAKNSNCGGVLSNSEVKIKHSAFIGRNVCVYGKNGVKIGQDLQVEPGARVGMENLDDLKLGLDSALPQGVLFEAQYTAPRANAIAEIINGWIGPQGNGTGGNPPNGWEIVGPLEALPETLGPMKIYFVEGDLWIRQDYQVKDVIIAVNGDVRWGHEGRFSNTQSCENGEAIGLYATGDIRIGHDPVGRGIDMVAGGSVSIGHDIGSQEMLIEAAGDIDFGHDPTYTNTCRPLFTVQGGARLRK